MSLPPLVLLAAGKSERMGTPKGLIDFEDEQLLTYTLRHFFSYGGGNVIIVLGYHHNNYFKHIPLLERAQNSWGPFEGGQIKTVLNSDPKRGQFSSIMTGLNELDEACFILPIDVPAPPEEIWYDLSTKLDENIFAIKPSYKKRGGHPVLLNRNFIAHIKTLDLKNEDARLDFQLNKLPEDKFLRVEVKTDSVCKNINTSDDISRN